MMKKLLSGNEAFARGIWESAVAVASGYPGTPSTEILENVAQKYKDVYSEWAPNEKVGFEVAAGAAMAGARAVTTMKHVGLNVAADALMTLTYLGVDGGFLAIVADDPGMHSSQNEQDTRNYAKFAKIPILEPADSQEAKDFVLYGLELSEKFRTPVILRSTTRISHSRTLVTEGERVSLERTINFQKNPQKYVPIPAWARPMRVEVEKRLLALAEHADTSPLNRAEYRDLNLGFITSGVVYEYLRETFPDASILKLGMSYPFPDKLLREFAAKLTSPPIVVEELDNILEEHLRAIGVECIGKEVVPNIGELLPDVLLLSLAKYRTSSAVSSQNVNFYPPTNVGGSPSSPPPLPPLPARPPVLCPGCSHRGIFYALGKFDVVVSGDIGCYTLGVFPPLNRIDTTLCMGGGVTVAHGMDKAKNGKKIVGIVGDSTFFHSGITGLIDIAYNKGAATIIVLDNRITAMTGHQDNPGTGQTLMGEPTVALSIEELGRACGIKNVVTVHPRELKATTAILKQAIESDEPWLIVAKAPCPLHLRERIGAQLQVVQASCKHCKLCLKLGCPAIERAGNDVTISSILCAGCGMCQTLCPAKAIVEVEYT